MVWFYSKDYDIAYSGQNRGTDPRIEDRPGDGYIFNKELWEVGEFPWVLEPFDLLQVLKYFISVGQSDIGIPLPSDIRRLIYQLETFLETYYKRGEIGLMKDEIESFHISDDRIGVDITQDQADLVMYLKSMMLAAFPPGV